MDDRSRSAQWRRNRSLEDLLAELSELLAPAEALCNERDRACAELPRRLGRRSAPQRYNAVDAEHRPERALRVSQQPARTLLQPRQPWVCASAHALGSGCAARRGARRPESARPAIPVRARQDGWALAPSEFWYFWRRFLPNAEIEPIGARLSDVDMVGLRDELRSITHAFGRPFATKGMLVQYDLPAFVEALPELLVVHVERESTSNAESLLEARQSFFGDVSRWYSAKPPTYPDLLALSPQEQVLAQVQDTNRCIAEGAAALHPESYLHVSYEEFCADPAEFHSRLRARLQERAHHLKDA